MQNESHTMESLTTNCQTNINKFEMLQTIDKLMLNKYNFVKPMFKLSQAILNSINICQTYVKLLQIPATFVTLI